MIDHKESANSLKVGSPIIFIQAAYLRREPTDNELPECLDSRSSPICRKVRPMSLAALKNLTNELRLFTLCPIE